jgi:hypothetical protein
VFLAAAAAGLACVGGVLAGCSSSSSKATASTAISSQTSSSSSPAASPSVSPASEAQLAKIVLQPADLPAGWKYTPYTRDPGIIAAVNAAAGALANCLGVPNSTFQQAAEAYSGTFDKGDATITSQAYSYRDQSVVDTDTAAIRSSKASPCLEQQEKRAMTAAAGQVGFTIESTSFKVTPGSAGDPTNVIATEVGIIKASQNGEPGAIYINSAFIGGPLIEARVAAVNIGTPVPTSLIDSLVAAVANRAAHP